jgi:multidrug efflux system membrane fusion protein
MRSVKVGQSENSDTIIVDGLQPGEVVSDSSFEKLVDGSQITISKIKLPSTSDTTSTAP